MKTWDLSKAAIVGFLITVVTVVILPLTVVPVVHRSEYFWIKIVWTEFLAAIAWSYIAWAPMAISHSSGQGSRLAALVPSIGIVVFSYIGLSLFFVLSSALAPDNEWLSRYHLARQIVITFIFLIICVGFYMTGKTAEQDNTNFSIDVRTPEQLAVILKGEEARIQTIAGERAVIKQFAETYRSLREKISYSLPNIQIMGNDPQYAAFTLQVNALVDSIRSCSDEASLKKDNLKEKIDDLLSQIDVMASRFNR